MDGINPNPYKGEFNTQAVAKAGLEKMEQMTPGYNDYHKQKQNITADCFLQSIEEKGDEKERILAHYGREAAKKLDSTEEFKTVLSFLSKKVEVPVGQAIAALAFKSYQDLILSEKSTQVGKVFMEGIKEHGTEDEKVFIQTAQQSTIGMYSGLASNIQEKAYHKLAEGFNKPIKEELIDFGINASKSVASSSTGYAYLSALEQFGTDKEKIFAKVIKEITIGVGSSESLVQASALETIGKGISGPMGMALTQFARRTMDAVGGRTDNCIDDGRSARYGSAFMKTIAENTDNEKEAVLTQAGSSMSFKSYWLPDRIINDILAGDQPIEGTLSDVGKRIFREADSRVLLKAIAEHGEDPKNVEVAKKTLEQTKGGFWNNLFSKDKDLKVHKKAFEDIFRNVRESQIKSEIDQLRK